MNFYMNLRNRLKAFTLLNVVFITAFTNAQNPIFRQSYSHRILTNPALIGTGHIDFGEAARIVSGTKAQWLGLNKKRMYTQNISVDMPAGSTNTSWGFSAFTTDLNSGNSDQSKYSHFSGMLAYAYNIRLRKTRLKLGMTAQFSSFTFGKEQFFWDDQINESMSGFVKPTAEPLAQITKNVFHASAGAVFYAEKGFLGVSAFNLNEPDISFYEGTNQKIPLKFHVIGGLNFKKEFDNYAIIPTASYTHQSDVQSISLMVNVNYLNFRVGAGAQNTIAYQGKAWALNHYFGARFKNYFVSYCTDWNLSINNASVPVTHEITLMVLPALKMRKRNPDPFPEF